MNHAHRPNDAEPLANLLLGAAALVAWFVVLLVLLPVVVG